MGWNCFKSEDNKEKEGKTPIGDRIWETLQNRFPRLYRLIKRIKETGAPSKIKIRRRRKINSVIPVTSPACTRAQEEILTRTNNEAGKSAFPRMTGAKQMIISDTSEQDKSNEDEAINAHGNKRKAIVATAPNLCVERQTLSVGSLGSSTDSISIRSFVDDVTLDKSVRRNSPISDQVGGSCYEQMKDGKDVAACNVIQADGIDEGKPLTPCDNLRRIIVSPAPNQDIEKDVRSASPNSVALSPSEQIASFVDKAIGNAVHETQHAETPDIKNIQADAGYKRQGHAFNETVWEVIDMDDEEDDDDVAEKQPGVITVVPQVTKSETQLDVSNMDEDGDRNAEDNVSQLFTENVASSTECYAPTSDDVVDKAENRNVGASSGHKYAKADSMMSGIEDDVLSGMELQAMPADGNLPGDSSAPGGDTFTERNVSFDDGATPPCQLRTNTVKSAADVKIKHNTISLDGEVLSVAKLDTEKGAARHDGIQAAGDEMHSTDAILNGDVEAPGNNVPVFHGGDTVKDDGSEAIRFMASVVREVVNNAVHQAQVN